MASLGSNVNTGVAVPPPTTKRVSVGMKTTTPMENGDDFLYNLGCYFLDQLERFEK